MGAAPGAADDVQDAVNAELVQLPAAADPDIVPEIPAPVIILVDPRPIIVRIADSRLGARLVGMLATKSGRQAFIT